MRNSTASYTSYKDQISQVRARIAGLLMEIDDITLQVNPRIEARYATIVGYLENDLLKWQIAARRAKRRCTLAQARANSGGTFAEGEFEAQLDGEFEQWKSLLARKLDAFLHLIERSAGSSPLPPHEARELKRLHRKLIMRLHPDLHPGQTGEAARFFEVAQSAYENGDLPTLRAIDIATEGMADEVDEMPMPDEEAAAELELALAQERLTSERLLALKREKPYTLKEKLEDPVWLTQRTSALKSQIEEQKAATRAYDERYHRLMEANGGEGKRR